MTMKKKPILHRLKKTCAALPLGLLALMPLTTLGQTYTNVYVASDNQKAYSTEMCTDFSTPGETVKAGTIFDLGSAIGKHVPHFLNVSSTGNVNYSVYYNDPNYEEMRVVDIVGDRNGGYGAPQGDATYYITCLGRTTQNDRIVVLPVDYTGALKGPALTIFCSTTPGGTTSFNDKNLYPLHSIYSDMNNSLYICGYMTTEFNGANGTSMSGTGQPDYNSDKMGFVLKATFNGTDWVGGTPTTAVSINSLILPTQGVEDYDIATRLVEKSTGDIFVTGSVNCMVQTGGGTDEWHSATMNVVINNTLATSTAIYEHFRLGSDITYTLDEYGVGLIEEGGNDYILGNYFFRYGSDGFDPQPYHFHATWVDATTHKIANPIFGYKTRAWFSGFDYAWAMQSLQPNLNPLKLSGAGVVRFLVAGLEVNEWCGNGGGTYSVDDVRTFLNDMELQCDGSADIQVGFNKWTTYKTQTGTGVQGADPSSYYDLGSGLSNVAWTPTFAAREGMEDIYLSAPVISPGIPSGTLQMKNLRVDGMDLNPTYLEDPNCSGSYASHDMSGLNGCGIYAAPYTTDKVHDLNSGRYYISGTRADNINNFNVGTSQASITTGNYTIWENDCSAMTGGGPYYKPTGVDDVVGRADDTQIFPNPASDIVRVALAKNIKDDAKVKVSLLNMTGQVVSVLYEGDAQALTITKELSVADVASGVYIVSISVDGQTAYTHKLNVQK